MKRIGMLTSGGDCQALNATMRGVAKGLYNTFEDVEVYGFLEGYKGLIYGNYVKMKPSDFSGILTKGGTILGSSRQPFKLIDEPTLYKDGLSANQLFHKVVGNADSYLDVKKLPARKKWSADSHKRKYENDWVVDILEGGANDDFELGYDYHTCGICSLCRDEGCFELAKYLCRMDYVLADMMHMRLVRTQTIAEGATYCDFRYSRIESASGKNS